MSNLNQKLNRILDIKNTSIIPGNIKKDVQIFDVTGTYEGGSSSKLKMFETISEMEQDNAEIDDIAMIYNEVFEPMQENSVITSIRCPSTVTLDEAITSSIYLSMQLAESGGGWFDGNMYLSSNSFSFDGYGEISFERIDYTSEDGIHYTRTSSNEFITFPSSLKKSYGTWSDAFGQFIQMYNANLEGIYKYQNGNNESKRKIYYNFNCPSKEAVVEYSTSTILVSKLKDIVSLLKTTDYFKNTNGTDYEGDFDLEIVNENEYNVYRYTSSYTSGTYSYNSFITSYMTNYLNNDDPNFYRYIYYSNDYTQSNFYKYTVNTQSRNVTRNTFTLVDETIYEGTTQRTIGVFTNVFTYKTLRLNNTTFKTSTNSIGLMMVPAEGSYQTQYINNSDVVEDYWGPLNSQLNIKEANQILPGISGLGMEGSITGDGSIYENLEINEICKGIFKGNAIENVPKIFYSNNEDYSVHYPVALESNKAYRFKEGNGLCLRLDPIINDNQLNLQGQICQQVIYTDDIYVAAVRDNWSSTGSGNARLVIINRQTEEVINTININNADISTEGVYYFMGVQGNNVGFYFIKLDDNTLQIYCAKDDEFSLVQTITNVSTTDNAQAAFYCTYDNDTDKLYFTIRRNLTVSLYCITGDYTTLNLVHQFDILGTHNNYTLTIRMFNARKYIYLTHRLSTSDAGQREIFIIDTSDNSVTSKTYTNCRISENYSAYDDEGNIYICGASGQNPLNYSEVDKLSPSNYERNYIYADQTLYYGRYEKFDITHNKLINNKLKDQFCICSATKGEAVYKSGISGNSPIGGRVDSNNIYFYKISNFTSCKGINDYVNKIIDCNTSDKYIMYDSENHVYYMCYFIEGDLIKQNSFGNIISAGDYMGLYMI